MSKNLLEAFGNNGLTDQTITVALLKHMRNALIELTSNEACYDDTKTDQVFADFTDIDKYINELAEPFADTDEDKTGNYLVSFNIMTAVTGQGDADTICDMAIDNIRDSVNDYVCYDNISSIQIDTLK